jgi:hypothetical protein
MNGLDFPKQFVIPNAIKEKKEVTVQYFWHAMEVIAFHRADCRRILTRKPISLSKTRSHETGRRNNV